MRNFGGKPIHLAKQTTTWRRQVPQSEYFTNFFEGK